MGLVPWAERVTKGPLMPKNCLVDVASSRLPTVGSLVLLEVMVERGDVDKRLVGKHT